MNEYDVKREDFTPAEIAEIIGNVTAKDVRRAMRALTDERPGKGGAWKVPGNAIAAIAERLNSRTGNRTTVTFKPNKAK